LLDVLERLVADEVQLQAGAPRAVVGHGRVVQAELAGRRAHLDPLAGARAIVEGQPERLVEADGRGQVGDEVDRAQPHVASPSSKRSSWAVRATSTSRESDIDRSIAACLARRMSAGGR